MVVRKLGSRYLVFDELASGGMATVHYGVARGQGGFQRIVAIKRLHESWARDPEFSALFLDEARMTSRVQHPNVVSMLDVVEQERELFIVMEYVAGAPLAQLLKLAEAQSERVPQDVAASIAAGVLSGLHAAHEAKSDRGEPLQIVHRDISPQNVLVGSDGLAKVVDFGIAKAAGRSTTTRDGKLKGKLAYMAPEQLLGQPATPQSDTWSASVVLWELLVGRRLYSGNSEGEVVAKIAHQRAPRPRELAPEISPELESVVMRGLARNPDKRFTTAREMALALEEATSLASAARVGAWVESLAGSALAERAARVRAIEIEAATQLPEPAQHAAAATPMRQRGLAVAVIAAALGAALFFFLSRLESAEPTEPTEPTAVSALPAPPPEVPSSTPSTNARAAPPVASASAPRTGAPRAQPSIRRQPPPKNPPSNHSPSCYRQDAEGIWHIKPACL